MFFTCDDRYRDGARTEVDHGQVMSHLVGRDAARFHVAQAELADELPPSI